MPKITTERKEFVMYAPEWKQTLAKAKETFGAWLSCWLAFDCIFGKRRDEISRLIRNNIWTDDAYLYTRFFIGKKKKRSGIIEQMPYTKKKTLKHYAAPYILEYLEEFDKDHAKDSYIFPSDREPSILAVKTTFTNKQGEKETRSYTYQKPGGYRSAESVYYYVKKVNPDMWPHLGRHAVGTLAAEEGATEYDISNILDVTARTASKYVHHGTKLTERWSEKTG